MASLPESKRLPLRPDTERAPKPAEDREEAGSFGDLSGGSALHAIPEISCICGNTGGSGNPDSAEASARSARVGLGSVLHFARRRVPARRRV